MAEEATASTSDQQMPGVPAVQVDGLTFSLIPGGAELLSDIRLVLPVGARCVLVGANGAGKSTLLELLAGNKMGPAGQIKVCGEDPFRSSSGKKVGLVQGGVRSAVAGGSDRASFMRVWEALGLPDTSIASAACGDRTKKLLDMLGLEHLLSRYCGSLSDGERRRVELGRKLWEPKEVYLLDEATADLDLLARRGVLQFLALEGATVVNVTHVFDGLDDWATHVLQMHEGKLVRLMSSSPAGEKPWQQGGGLFASMVQWLHELGSGCITAAHPTAAMSPDQRTLGNSESCCSAHPALEVQSLAFSYTPWSPVALRLDEMRLPRGCRCAMVGLNGAGKSTFLAVLAGRKMVAEGVVRVLGAQAFHDHTTLDPQVSILSTEWKQQVAEMSSARALSFRELVDVAIRDASAAGLEASTLAARMLHLIQILGIDPTKPLGTLSDGMLRRVQIALTLLRPAKVLLVDEVTADLDVVGRHALLAFLRDEAAAGAAVLYCTHVLDGLEGWASHLLRLRPGGLSGELTDLQEGNGPAEAGSVPLFEQVLKMLEQDSQVPLSLMPVVPPSSGAGDASADAQKQQEELPFGWGDRGARHAGAFGNYAWNAETGPAETWSFASVAPEPPKMPGSQVGVGSGMGVSSTAGAGGQGGGFSNGGIGVFGVPGGGNLPAGPVGFGPTAVTSSPCPFGPGTRSNTAPLHELVARGAILPQQ